MTNTPTEIPVVVGPFSLDEYFEWDGRLDGDDGTSDPPMWELVDGMAIMTPSPSGRHQEVVFDVLRLLLPACPPGWAPIPGPVDWIVLPQRPTVRVPDLAVVPRPLPDRLTDPPLLLVEVVSPRGRRRDLEEKRADYAAGGLLHYWVVDPAAAEVTVFAGPGLPEAARATGDEVLELSEPLPVRFAPNQLLP